MHKTSDADGGLPARLAFLAMASQVLSESLDYETTLGSIARLAVPALADWCAVHMVAADGSPRWLAVAHVDPEKERWAQGRFDRPLRADSGDLQGVYTVLRTGRSEIYPEITDDTLAGLRDPGSLEVIRRMGCRSVMIVPLPVRGRTLGTISFILCESDRLYEPADLAFAEDLGRRAALAIDNARLYREAQEAVRARDDFLAIASHELKTPLNAQSLCVQSLQRRIGKLDLGEAPKADLQALLTAARGQIERQARLINLLLDASHLTAGRLDLDLGEMDLSALARDVAARLGRESERSGSTVSVHAGGPVIGRWDRLRLDQAIEGLLDNAIRYGAGQPIDVSVQRDEKGARILVHDRGIGIAPEHQERIFERFERAQAARHYGGLGLGLWIAREIVKALGGTIRVESAPGAGSTFCIQLPQG